MASSQFDDKAATWDDADKRHRAQVIAEAVTASVPFDQSTRLLEYGAGTGLVSEFFAQATAKITLADPSAGMRDVAQEKIDSGTLPADAVLWDLDLETSDAPDGQFDVIVTVMTLHHVANLQAVFSGFSSMLAPGGRLCIIDFEKEDGSFHDDPDAHVHNGFDSQELAQTLTGAGFASQFFNGIHCVTKDDRAYPLFLAVCGRKGK